MPSSRPKQPITPIHTAATRVGQFFEVPLSDLFQNGWPAGITENQHQALGAWLRRKVADGQILRADDIDIPTGKIHNIYYRRVEGSGQAWVRMSLSRKAWSWIDQRRDGKDRTSFLQDLIESKLTQ